MALTRPSNGSASGLRGSADRLGLQVIGHPKESVLCQRSAATDFEGGTVATVCLQELGVTLAIRVGTQNLLFNALPEVLAANGENAFDAA